MNELVEKMLREWNLGNTVEVAHLLAELYSSNDYTYITETMDEFKNQIGQYYAMGTRLIPENVFNDINGIRILAGSKVLFEGAIYGVDGNPFNSRMVIDNEAGQEYLEKVHRECQVIDTLRKGDKVLFASGKDPKEYEIIRDEYICSGERVVDLEGYSGEVAVKYLIKMYD